MKHNKDINLFRSILISLVILVHIVNFGHIYPSVKSSILSFLMPAFLMLTGYLVNINKSIKDFAQYILKIWLPYMFFVIGYAILSLHLPVSDGIKILDTPTMLNILFIKSIGPYWFLHVMMVCGIIYYSIFRLFHNSNTITKYSLFATAIILISFLTPFLNIKAAIYYFIGVGIKHFIGDFSLIYRKSLWPIIPFSLLITRTDYHDWGTISVLVCVISFFCFSSFFISFLKEGKVKSLLEYIGRNTFPIYVFHPIFTMLSKFLLPVFRLDSTGIIHAISTVVIGIIGSLCMARCLDLLHISYLLGRKKILR